MLEEEEQLIAQVHEIINELRASLATVTQDQQRLINSNEHWHVRVEQMIREVEQVTREVEQVTQERDAAEMRSVAHLKMYTEASQQLEAMTKERDEMKAYVSRIRLGQELVFIRKQLAMARQHIQELEAMEDVNEALKDHELIADLRDQLAAMTQERDEQCAGKIAFFNGMNDMLEQRTALERQLATVTKERDEAVRIAKGLMELAPITDADVKWAEAKLAAQKHQGGLP